MLLFYDVFVTELSERLVPTDSFMVLVNSGSLCSDLDSIQGSYTYLQISDGVNYEIVKVTGCNESNILIERGQGGSAAQTFEKGACVSFRLNAQTISDFVCQLSCSGQEDIVCNVITQTGEHLDISRDGCTIAINFLPYESGEGIDIDGKTISINVCDLPGLAEPDNSTLFIVCHNGEPMQTSFAAIQTALGDCFGGGGGGPINGVLSIIPGDRIDVGGTPENPIVSVDDIHSGFSYLGMTIDAKGFITSAPGVDPVFPPALPDGVYDPAKVTIAGGVITVVESSTSLGVLGVVQGTGVVVDNSNPEAPIISLPDSPLSGGTYNGIVTNNKGIVIGQVALPSPVTDVSTSAPSVLTVTETSPGEFEIVHNAGALGAAGEKLGIVYDDYGHVVDVNLPFFARWTGDKTSAEIGALGLSAAGTDTLTFTFIPSAAPNDDYQVIANDDAGVSYAVSSKGTGSFIVDFTASSGQVYVSVIG